MKQSAHTPVKSADRILDIFEVLSRRGAPMSQAEISAALNIPKSSASLLLRNLLGRNYLAFDSTDNTYTLGPALFALAGRGQAAVDINEAAQKILNRLTAVANESCSVAWYRDGEMERGVGADSTHALAYRMNVGERYPLYASASGKSVLAFLPAGELDAYLARTPLKPVTPRTIVDRDELKRQLAAVAESRISRVFEENTVGIVSIASPVFGAARTPVGAITVSVPTARYGEALDRLIVAELGKAASALQRELDRA